MEGFLSRSSNFLILAAAITTFSNMTFAITCLSFGVIGSLFNFFIDYGEKIEKKESSESTKDAMRKVLSTFASESDNKIH